MPRARADVVSPSPQPSPKRRGRFGSFCCRFCSGRLGISPASAILDCRAWPWLGTGPSATSLLFDSRLSLLRGWWSVEEFEGHWCLELVPMWSHPHPNPLPKGEGDLDPFVAGSVRGDWASRRPRQSWIVARGPGCGQAPALHLSYSILGCRCYEDGGRWKSSRVIGASSSCRCGLTLTPTLSQKERAIWILLLPVPFGAVGHFAGFGNPGLSRVALAGDKPQRYISPSTLGCGCSGDGGWCRRPGGHDDPASADSPLQEILAGVAGAGHP